MTIRRNFAKILTSKLLRLAPFQRRLLLLAADALLLPLAVWLSFWLRLAHPFHVSFIARGWWLLPAILLIGLPFYAFSGQYKGLTRYVGSRALYQLELRNSLLVLMLVAFGLLLETSNAATKQLVVALVVAHGSLALCALACVIFCSACRVASAVTYSSSDLRCRGRRGATDGSFALSQHS